MKIKTQALLRFRQKRQGRRVTLIFEKAFKHITTEMWYAIVERNKQTRALYEKDDD